MREKEVRLVVKKQVCVFKPRKGTASLRAPWFGAHPASGSRSHMAELGSLMPQH